MTGLVLNIVGSIASRLIGSHLVKQHVAGGVPNSLEHMLVGLTSRAVFYVVLGLCLGNAKIRQVTELWLVTVGHETGIQLWSAVKGLFGI